MHEGQLSPAQPHLQHADSAHLGFDLTLLSPPCELSAIPMWKLRGQGNEEDLEPSGQLPLVLDERLLMSYTRGTFGGHQTRTTQAKKGSIHLGESWHCHVVGNTWNAGANMKPAGGLLEC